MFDNGVKTGRDDAFKNDDDGLDDVIETSAKIKPGRCAASCSTMPLARTTRRANARLQKQEANHEDSVFEGYSYPRVLGYVAVPN